ncbi:hypothetical protein FRC01_011680, partial [Tulasnella sp. 417]
RRLIPKLNRVDNNESEFDTPKDAEITFYHLLGDYLDILRQKDPSGNPAQHSILHYVVTAKNAQVLLQLLHAPPTDLNFQNLPFFIEDTDRTSATSVLSGMNSTLVYLQKTDGRKLPKSLLEPSVGVPITNGRTQEMGEPSLEHLKAGTFHLANLAVPSELQQRIRK